MPSLQRKERMLPLWQRSNECYITKKEDYKEVLKRVTRETQEHG